MVDHYNDLSLLGFTAHSYPSSTPPLPSSNTATALELERLRAKRRALEAISGAGGPTVYSLKVQQVCMAGGMPRCVCASRGMRSWRMHPQHSLLTQIRSIHRRHLRRAHTAAAAHACVCMSVGVPPGRCLCCAPSIFTWHAERASRACCVRSLRACSQRCPHGSDHAWCLQTDLCQGGGANISATAHPCAHNNTCMACTLHTQLYHEEPASHVLLCAYTQTKQLSKQAAVIWNSAHLPLLSAPTHVRACTPTPTPTPTPTCRPSSSPSKQQLLGGMHT